MILANNMENNLLHQIIAVCIFLFLFLIITTHRLIKNLIKLEVEKNSITLEPSITQKISMKSINRNIISAIKKFDNYKYSRSDFVIILPVILFLLPTTVATFLIDEIILKITSWINIIPIVLCSCFLLVVFIYFILSIFKEWKIDGLNLYDKIMLLMGQGMILLMALFQPLINSSTIKGYFYLYFYNYFIAAILHIVIILAIFHVSYKLKKQQYTNYLNISKHFFDCFVLLANIDIKTKDNIQLLISINTKFYETKPDPSQKNIHIDYYLEQYIDFLITIIKSMFNEMIEIVTQKRLLSKIKPVLEANKTKFLQEKITESFYHFIRGMIGVDENNYEKAKKEINNAIICWEKIQIKNIRRWSKVFQSYIEYIQAITISEPELQPKSFGNMATCHKRSYPFYKEKDDWTYFYYATYELLYLARKSRIGYDKRTKRKVTRIMSSLNFILADNEKDLLIFLQRIFSAIENYTKAGLVKEEEVPFRNYANENITDAKKYIQNVNSIIGSGFITKNTLERIEQHISSKAPQQKPDRKIDVIFTFIILVIIIPTLINLFTNYFPQFNNPWISYGMLIALGVIIILYIGYRLLTKKGI